MKDLHERETIVAVATPVGRGGIGVVRISGPGAVGVVAPLVRLRRPLAAGRARFGEIVDTATGQVLDEAVVTYFAGPRSYTGEDVVEVAAHGSPVVMEYLLRACCAGGARLAEAGEFTERAFLAGRLDLTQAEAVADLIASSTLEQARVAARQLGGALARAVGPAKERLVLLIAGLEAGIDFAEDDIAVMAAAEVAAQIAAVEAPLAELERSFAYGRVLREGFTLALVGRPNAGKSSLFNRLLERDRAIVTATPGTTRDVVAERLSMGGVPVELLDTAGLRAGEVDEAERLGIARSRAAMAEAAVVLLVVDATAPLDAEDVAVVRQAAGRSLVVVLNKVDLLDGSEETAAEASLRELELAEMPVVARTSALTGAGVEELRSAVMAVLQVGAAGEGSVMVTNLRQHQAIVATLAALGAAQDAVTRQIPHEMVLLDLYEALRSLDSLTGATTTEEILRLIFGKFCIGK